MRVLPRRFSEWTSIFVTVALVSLLVWLLFNVVLIVVGSILIALLLDVLSEPFVRWAKAPRKAALVISGLIVISVFGAAGYLFGTHVGAELRDIFNRADAGTNALSVGLQNSDLGKLVLARVQNGVLSIASLVSSAFSVSASFIESVLVTLIAGFYFAAEPTVYRFGLSNLFPQRSRDRVNETIDDLAVALRLWLIGQLIQMALIGALCALAVWLIGLPSPLGLGLIAAVAEFIPFLGPIIAAVPALLVATASGFDAAMLTLVAYLIIHQIESDIISPLMQRRMVYIPPAVMLLGIVAISSVFGIAALIFAAPLVVIVFVAIEKLYVRDTLGDEVALPGEHSCEDR